MLSDAGRLGINPPPENLGAPQEHIASEFLFPSQEQDTVF